jgi:hypothetical protein
MQLALFRAGQAGRADGAGEVGSARKAGRDRSTLLPIPPVQPRLCAACSAREARYGFRNEHDDDPAIERPRTLCFDCFRMEMDRRRIVAAQLARGWNATQTELPLAATLETLARRRGRAQIAARRALHLR